ncbi:MAG: M48 family metalloprotease [Deltaproteobacteria bacterium]|nr:M48 family metalloprotease [Deltaproteobacteria bacterium]
MFSNFIYFIIVLLIYSTYQPSEETNFGSIETFFLFIGLIVIFTWITWMQFRRIEKGVSNGSVGQLSHKFSSTVNRHSIMAIVLFSIDIYGLNLSSFFTDIHFLALIPTVQALLFLGLFISYLSIVWACAHGTYKILSGSDLSRRSYILSQISFSVPVLLPWLLLSGVADIINALPFEALKRFLSTTQGQMAYFLIFLFAIAIAGPAIIQKFWRCKPLETGYYRQRIENLCRKAGIEYAEILYWPMEVDAVIAHEIGHVKKKHLVFYLVFFLGYMLISFATFDLLVYFIIFTEPIYSLISHTGLDQTTVTSSIFSFIIIIFFLIYFRFIFGYFMRNFERQADTYVYTLFDSALPLISCFQKIAATSGEPYDKPNWHHFSIKKRIEYLRKCETDRAWVTRQDNKIIKSIAVYLVGILLIGAIGYNLNFGETGRKLNKHFFEKIIQRELGKTPDNPNLYSTLGDLYFSEKKYAQTITAYEQSLAIEPDNPHALNNLAWLHATCEVPKFRDPQKALYLAEKAAGLEQSPYILDTLAESYFANGRFEEAVESEIKAEAITKNS